MSIDVRNLTDDAETWNDLVTASRRATPFHRYEALEVFAEEASATLHPLAGFKGEEPVGVFPVFTITYGPVTAVVSPPPDLKVEYLGPVPIYPGQPKRRRREKVHGRFIDACLDWIDDRYDPEFTSLRTPVGYDDVRPFVWRDFEVTPRYTYVVDLRPGPNELLSRFSSDARRNVTNDYDVDFRIEVEGPGTIRRIVRQVRERHEEQGETFEPTGDFLATLYERLPRGAIRPYGCYVDGEFAGGIIQLESDGWTYGWIGGAKPSRDVPVNDLLDWRICRDAIDRGQSAYDLVGANNPRLCEYKAKFSPDLETYYLIQRGSRGMNVASKLYRRFF